MKLSDLKGILMFSALLFFGTSCGFDTDRGPDGGASGEGSNPVETSDRDYPELKEFAMEAAGMGIMEIELSQIALEKSDHAGLKALAESIKNDHEKANEKLEEILDNYHWDIPTEMTEKQERMVDKLGDVSDEEIDEAYLRMMVSTHQKAIEKFNKIIHQKTDEDQAYSRDSERLNLGYDDSDTVNTQDTTIVSPPEGDRGTPPTMGSKSSNVAEDDWTDDYDEAPADTAPGSIPNREQAYSTYKEEGAEDAGVEGKDRARYADNVEAPQLKRWITSTLPKLKLHLNESREMMKKMDLAE